MEQLRTGPTLAFTIGRLHTGNVIKDSLMRTGSSRLVFHGWRCAARTSGTEMRATSPWARTDSHAFIIGRQNLTVVRSLRLACLVSNQYRSAFHDLSDILEPASEQGLELGARAMIEAGAEMIFTSQPSPDSQLDIDRNTDGSVKDPAGVEQYICKIHSQGIRPHKHPRVSI